MKYIISATLLLMIGMAGYAQGDVKLEQLKTPASPGFQLLDVSPSNVERPTNPKALGLGILNLGSSGTAIPKNFSFEFSPYWLFKHDGESVYQYLNIRQAQGGGKNKDYLFAGFFRKMSFSLTSSYSDSTAGSLLKNTNYVAAGVRTNVFTVRSGNQYKRMTQALADISARVIDINKRLKRSQDSANRAVQLYTIALRKENDEAKKAELAARLAEASATAAEIGDAMPDKVESMYNEDKALKQHFAILEETPLFQLNAAYAYSGAFGDNEYKNKRFNRSAVWADAAVSGKGLAVKWLSNFNFIASLRFMKDNVLTDTAKVVFDTKNALDWGGKLEYTIDRFSIAVEYLKRNYSDANGFNSERTVGIVQYKISDNLYVTGTYGKNFGNFKNLFTLLGVNWGLGKSDLKL